MKEASKLWSWRTIGKKVPTSDRGGGEPSLRKECKLRRDRVRDPAMQRVGARRVLGGALDGVSHVLLWDKGTVTVFVLCQKEMKEQCFELGHSGAGAKERVLL